MHPVLEERIRKQLRAGLNVECERLNYSSESFACLRALLIAEFEPSLYGGAQLRDGATALIDERHLHTFGQDREMPNDAVSLHCLYCSAHSDLPMTLLMSTLLTYVTYR